MARMTMHFKEKTDAVKALCGKKIDTNKHPAVQVWSIVTCKDCKTIKELTTW